MSVELPTNGSERNELEEDAVIEAESILRYAEVRLSKLNTYLEQVPPQQAEQVDKLKDLWQAFKETGEELEKTYEKISAGGDIDLASELVQIRGLEFSLRDRIRGFAKFRERLHKIGSLFNFFNYASVQFLGSHACFAD